MNKRSKTFFSVCLLVSFLFHAALLSIIQYLDSPIPFKEESLPVKLVGNIIHEVPELPKKVLSHESSDPKALLKNLGMASYSSANLAAAVVAAGSKVGKFGDRTGAVDQLNDGNNSIYYYLYQYIGANTYYPKIFRDKKIEGHVTVRIVFDRRGVYLHSLTRIESNSGFLKVLLSRTLLRIFARPLPFDLSFLKHDYFLFDATFRFKATPEDNQGVILASSFVNGRHFGFFIQNETPSMIGFRRNSEGMLKLGMNYEDVIDWVKENFTSAGKLRKQFYEQQLELYKEDPAWSH